MIGMTVTNGTTTEQRLAALRSRIDKAREERARAEATLEQLETQRQGILAELAELGVTEDELPGEIDRLAREIEERLAEAERLLTGGVPVGVDYAATR